jgi:ankyrin repeat protein
MLAAGVPNLVRCTAAQMNTGSKKRDSPPLLSASLLLSAGADADAQNAKGQRPLDVAPENGHFQVAELIREV